MQLQSFQSFYCTLQRNTNVTPKCIKYFKINSAKIHNIQNIYFFIFNLFIHTSKPMNQHRFKSEIALKVQLFCKLSRRKKSRWN